MSADRRKTVRVKLTRSIDSSVGRGPFSLPQICDTRRKSFFFKLETRGGNSRGNLQRRRKKNIRQAANVLHSFFKRAHVGIFDDDVEEIEPM